MPWAGGQLEGYGQSKGSDPVSWMRDKNNEPTLRLTMSTRSKRPIKAAEAASLLKTPAWVEVPDPQLELFQILLLAETSFMREQ